MKITTLVLSAIITTLAISSPSFAQSHRRTDANQAKNNQPGEPGRPRPGGPPTANNAGIPTNAQPAGFTGNTLKPRELKDADLAAADERKYTSSISSLEKQAAAPARANQTSSPTLPIATQFRLGSIHLRYGQETKASEAFTRAWTGLPEILKEAKITTAAAGLARAHLIELQKLTPKDPALVLAVMIALSPQHQAAFKAIEQPKLKQLLGMPLAATWTQLMQFGQLEKTSLEKGAGWVLMFPTLVTANQPLPPDMRSEYESQITQVSIKINERIRLLAERQRGQAIGMRGNMQSNANAEAQGNDLMLQQTMANLDAKRSPLMKFMNADIAFRFNQFQDGLRDTTTGWKELIELYRAANAVPSTADTDMHFDVLSQIVTANPVQGAVLLDHLDMAYRTVTPTMPFVGTKIADTWTKLATELPLRAAMLEKAVFWNEHVAKAGKDTKAPDSAALADLKKRLDEAKKNEETKANSTENQAAAKPSHTTKDPNSDTQNTKTQSRQTGSGRITIPKTIDPSGTGQ